MPVYNEADILEQTIAYTIAQGISLIILDGGSTDRSLEIARRFIGQGVLEVKVLADEYLRWSVILKEGISRAAEESPDWIVKVDADQFLEPPMRKMTLADAIEAVDAQGYNLIKFDCFEFLLTDQDYQSSEPDVRKRLRFYTWIGDYYFCAWKNYPGTDLIATGGHKPIFPSGIKTCVFPTNFTLRHYRFRSLDHGLRKVFKERLPRYAPEERARKWHVHFNKFKPDPSYFIVDSRKLNRYDGDGQWVIEKVFDPFFGAWTPTDPSSSVSARLRAIVKKLLRRI